MYNNFINFILINIMNNCNRLYFLCGNARTFETCFDNAYEKFVLMTMVATHLIYPLIFPTTWCLLKKLIN